MQDALSLALPAAACAPLLLCSPSLFLSRRQSLVLLRHVLSPQHLAPGRAPACAVYQNRGTYTAALQPQSEQQILCAVLEVRRDTGMSTAAANAVPGSWKRFEVWAAHSFCMGVMRPLLQEQRADEGSIKRSAAEQLFASHVLNQQAAAWVAAAAPLATCGAPGECNAIECPHAVRASPFIVMTAV